MLELNEAIREIFTIYVLNIYSKVKRRKALPCRQSPDEGTLKVLSILLNRKPTSGISTSAARASNKVIPGIRTQGV